MNPQQKYEKAYGMLRAMYAKRLDIKAIRRAEKMVRILSNRMYEARWSSNKIMIGQM